MSTNVGSIHYDLKLNTTDFDRQSAVVKSKLSTVGGGLNKLGNSAVALAGGMAAVGTALALAGNAALNNASDYQQSRIAFDTMLGSAEKGQAIMKQLSEFAKKTPFDLPQVVQGAKSLLAYGIEAEKIVPTFNALGNIAAGVGRDKLPQLTLAFGQVKTAGRLTGNELRQFTEAGVPLLEALAKQSGKSAAQIKDDMERGIAPSFEEVNTAIMGMSEKGGKFFNLMEMQSNTFAGRMSNIGDSIGQIIRGMLGVDVEGNIEPGSVFDKVSKKAEELMKWLEANKGRIEKNFKDAFNWIIDNGDKIAVLVGTVLVIAFAKLAIAVAAATWPVLLVAAAVLGLYLLYERFKPQIDSVIAKFQQFWESIKPIRDWIVNQFKKAWDDLKIAVSNLMNSLKPYEEQLKLLGMIILVSMVAPLVILIGIFGFLVLAVIKVITWIVQLQTWINNSVTAFNNWARSVATTVASAILNIISYVASLINAFRNIPGNIVTVFRALGGFLYNVGVDAIRGLLQGMINMAGSVYNKAREIANNITNTLKNALRIKSPSQVMANIGLDIGRGVELGMQKSMPNINAMAGSMAAGITAPIGNLAGNGNTPTQNTSVSNNIYGNISLGDQSAVDRFFDRLNRNGELSAKGMTTI
jgi:tape measure domain-containing protein